MFNLNLAGDGTADSGLKLTPGMWHDLRFEWKDADNPKSGSCEVLLDGKHTGLALRLNRQTINGINYVHFISTANSEDEAGFLIESVAAAVQ